VDDARDDSWRGSFEVLLYLAAKPPALSYGLPLSDEGIRPYTKRCLVLSLL
jgi:hypothetical protein